MKHTFCMLLTAALVWPLFAAAPPVVAQTTSLIQDGDFERGNLDLWDTCGGVRLADTQAGASASQVHSGRYAMRLGGPTDRTCGGGNILVTQLQAYYTDIAVPNDAEALTLSFWYSRVGDYKSDDPGLELTALLSTDDDQPQVRILGYIGTSEAAGWNQARFELAPDEIAQVHGRTVYLSFTVDLPLYEGDNLAYYLDEVQVLPYMVRTPVETAAPQVLADDTSGALVGYAVLNGSGVTARANLDGSNAAPVFAGAAGDGSKKARWSKDGSMIGVLEDWIQPEPGEQPSINSAQITTLTVMQADGSGQREVYRTIGKKLVPGTPPGCRPPRTDCGPYDNPAIDSYIVDFDWSPDSRTVALNICILSRYGDGYTDDALCSIQFVDVASGTLHDTKIEPAFGVHWSRANRLIYHVGIEGPLLYQTAKGMYEADMSASPPATRLLFEHQSPTKPLEDVAATWAPDGRQFVTFRFVPGNHSNANGQSDGNAAIMLFDRENPDTPRQLVLMDYGRSLSTPAWSPDGRYLSYSVEVSRNSWETWWLEVATGKTGLLTGDLVFADWRPAGGVAALPFKLYLPALVR